VSWANPNDHTGRKLVYMKMYSPKFPKEKQHINPWESPKEFPDEKQHIDQWESPKEFPDEKQHIDPWDSPKEFPNEKLIFRNLLRNFSNKITLNKITTGTISLQ